MTLCNESPLGRYRRAAALAIAEFCQNNADVADGELERLWPTAMRALDDINEGVAGPANSLAKVVRLLTLARPHPELMPMLLDKGLIHENQVITICSRKVLHARNSCSFLVLAFA